MESFAVDKSLYEIDDDDLNDLWSTESFDSCMRDVDLVNSGDQQDWGSFLSESQSPAVILNDRMMTDAAAQYPRGVQTDHSYSLSNGCSSECQQDAIKIEYDKDMDSDCFLAVPMNSVSQNYHVHLSDGLHIKSEPPSPPPSCSSGSSSGRSSPMHEDNYDLLDDGIESPLSCSSSHRRHNSILAPTPSFHHPQSLLKQPTIVLATRQNSQFNNQSTRRMVFPKVNIKVQQHTPGFLLPPTPPSSSNGSDTESSGSPSPTSSSSSVISSIVSSSSNNIQSNKVIVTSTTTDSVASKCPNTSSLISSQPKGATGILVLTEEEKRTLIAEGYPIPQRLPLTKAEEKSLKKIRRKIKNKISAQESRRKKKEYMDTLEKKVEILQNENSEYKRKVDSLESNNLSLLSQLRQLQMLVGDTSSKLSTRLLSQSTSIMPKKQHSGLSKSSLKI